MADNQDEKKSGTTPTGSGGKQTPLEEGIRRTGQGSNTDTRPGAAPEAPGNDPANVEGSPNQGTESR